ncbi:HlyD family type I secretion periplasmic adaptor subunit [Sediminicoccus sp. KRV36]|uniref:HlyD family type I secretion periplasmic adaptor subunit n=1 Tax=Sediminicoccus sp. KRV36 TaxID=3133721 RepID=UPI00200C560B|nr:HlyD family type I secretion periplasmic adaptor subunit [Sediminicoccus rosea]UPY37013.1 HlyD family type I secretion periplasmic adaptor subunit [Sediminicoccus rosea]
MTENASPDDPYLDDGVIRHTLNLAALVIIMVVAAAIAWAVVTPVDEIARAQGAVVPTGNVQVVDARDGGLVQEVFTREGAEVRQGAPILRFNRVREAAELATALANRAAAEIAIERLSAFIDDRAPDFSAFAAQYPNLVAREQAALDAQRRLLGAEMSTVEQQIVARRAQLAAIGEQLPAFEDEIRALTASREMIEGLATRGLASQLRVADLIEQQARANRAFAEARGQRLVTMGQLAELDVAMQGRRQRAQAEAAEHRVEAGVRFRSLTEQVATLRDRVENAVVTAPVSGLVQSLPAPRAGMVVNPGGTVAEIVPSAEGLQFEARLSPRDVGFVTPGQRARVKVDAYDFSRFGALTGEVVSVSATTVSDPRTPPYYRLRIRLDQTGFRDDPGLQLQAGMTGEADVTTGAKTVFRYLWKPIYTVLDLAFTER